MMHGRRQNPQTQKPIRLATSWCASLIAVPRETESQSSPSRREKVGLDCFSSHWLPVHAGGQCSDLVLHGGSAPDPAGSQQLRLASAGELRLRSGLGSGQVRTG